MYNNDFQPIRLFRNLYLKYLYHVLENLTYLRNSMILFSLNVKDLQGLLSGGGLFNIIF